MIRLVEKHKECVWDFEAGNFVNCIQKLQAKKNQSLKISLHQIIKTVNEDPHEVRQAEDHWKGVLFPLSQHSEELRPRLQRKGSSCKPDKAHSKNAAAAGWG